MIQATLRYYPQQRNANGTRGVWRVIGCREVNMVPHKRMYTSTMGVRLQERDHRVLRLVCARMYKKGSRVDPRKMLGLKTYGMLPRASEQTVKFRRYETLGKFI
jgi:hypothetical protein